MYLYSLQFSNGKEYIGISMSPRRRFLRHRDLINQASHRHLPVYQAIRKYGMPTQRILCDGERDYIAQLEIKVIEAFHTRDRRFGYNVALGGDINPTASEEVRAKLSAAAKGRPLSPEHRAKLSIAHRGVPLSAEHRAHAGAARKGRPHSTEHKAAISAALKGRPSKTGWSHSAENRAKIGAGRSGKAMSAEQRMRVSAAQKGGRHPHKGFTPSAETIAKRRATLQKR